MLLNQDWNKTNTKIFWGEIAPSDHVVQIYENNEVFLDTLAGFVGDGINSGDSIIIIATSPHLKALEKRLKEHAINVKALIANDQYIPLNAHETLAEFMVNGWPDEGKFMKLVSNLLKRAKKRNRHVRAFGEMVAILWEEGHNGATVQLEHLWNKFCKEESFCLFCAYPKSGFTQNAEESMKHICSSHTMMLNGTKNSSEITYSSVS